MKNKEINLYKKVAWYEAIEAKMNGKYAYVVYDENKYELCDTVLLLSTFNGHYMADNEDKIIHDFLVKKGEWFIEA